MFSNRLRPWNGIRSLMAPKMGMDVMERRRADMQGQRSTEGDLYRQKARETRIPELRREYLRIARELDPYGEVLRKIRAEMSPWGDA